MTVPSNELIASPCARPVFYDGVNVNDVFRAENLAVKARDAMLAKFDHWAYKLLLESRDTRVDGDCLHVDHIRRTDVIANAAPRALIQFDRLDHPSMLALAGERVNQFE
jgi:hypothetical protein